MSLPFLASFFSNERGTTPENLYMKIEQTMVNGSNFPLAYARHGGGYVLRFLFFCSREAYGGVGVGGIYAGANSQSIPSSTFELPSCFEAKTFDLNSRKFYLTHSGAHLVLHWIFCMRLGHGRNRSLLVVYKFSLYL